MSHFLGRKKRDTLCLPTIMNHETDHIDLDPNNSYRELTQQQREEVMRELLFDFQHGRLKRGAITKVAKKFAVNHTTISRLWKLASFNRDPNHINFLNFTRKTHLRVMYHNKKFKELVLRKCNNSSLMKYINNDFSK